SSLTRELVRLFPAAFSLKKGAPCAFAAGRAAGYEIAPVGKGWRIDYAGLDDLVMALGDVLSAGKPRAAAKTAPLAFRGIMLDVSRNAVVRVDFLKERLARLALMGL